MLNQDRIRTMTRLAIYEEEQSLRDEKVGGYFGNDYVFSQIMISVIAGTAAFAVVFGVYCVYHLDAFVLRLFDNTILEVIRRWAKYYAIFIAGYCAVTFFIYRARFRSAQSRIKKYRRDLEFMAEEYEVYDKVNAEAETPEAEGTEETA